MLRLTRKLRIGLVANEFPPKVGGMEQHALGLARALSAWDEVAVYSFIGNDEDFQPYRFHVHAVLTGKCHEDCAVLAKETVDFWLVLNAGYATLAQWVRKPVFVYCHGNDFAHPWIPQLVIEAVLARILKKTPYIWRHQKDLIQRIRRFKIFRALTKAPLVFFNSAYTKDLLLEKRPMIRDRVAISHPGVADHFFTTSPPYRSGHRTDKPTLKLLTIARLSKNAPHKNVDGLLRALCAIRDDVDFASTIIGDGDRLFELQLMAKDLNLDKQVRFLGGVQNSDLPGHFDNADLFVLVPTGVESFGMVYAEAAARGVPSLISRLGGATDAIQEGRSGIIVDDPTPEGIAKGIHQFLEFRDDFNPEEIRRFSERFKWKSIAEKMRQKIIQALP